MKLNEIKAALDAGVKVFWSSECYDVIKDVIKKKDEPDFVQYLINCNQNNYCIGLTHQDGVTMNGEEGDFFYIKNGRKVFSYSDETTQDDKLSAIVGRSVDSFEHIKSNDYDAIEQSLFDAASEVSIDENDIADLEKAGFSSLAETLVKIKMASEAREASLLSD